MKNPWPKRDLSREPLAKRVLSGETLARKIRPRLVKVRKVKPSPSFFFQPAFASFFFQQGPQDKPTEVNCRLLSRGREQSAKRRSNWARCGLEVGASVNARGGDESQRERWRRAKNSLLYDASKPWV